MEGRLDLKKLELHSRSTVCVLQFNLLLLPIFVSGQDFVHISLGMCILWVFCKVFKRQNVWFPFGKKIQFAFLGEKKNGFIYNLHCKYYDSIVT